MSVSFGKKKMLTIFAALIHDFFYRLRELFVFQRSEPYFIAEVGQNHQGSVALALEYVNEFAVAGADAVKFQMRDNKALFSSDKYNSVYNSDNAFADTYGAHREALELSFDEMFTVRQRCRDVGVDFICTPFDENSLSALSKMGPDAIKVASFDLGNIPFLQKIARLGLPVVMSTGGGNLEHVEASITALTMGGSEIAILHCVSKYPCSHDELLLGRIVLLKERFPELIIGSSDHFNGILSGPIALMLGATVFEKHVTFDRSSKGTDHSFALEKEGFRKFVRDVKRTNEMIEGALPPELGREPVFKKLGKSVVAARNIAVGEIITAEALSGKIFTETFIPVRESAQLLGTVAIVDISAGVPLTWEAIEQSHGH
ncbi:N-acetylneuraminate synthase family protein [Luminiphilus sp.]|nr:N-acetylneuraminate synthase family protein [Luminiphilus sp.]